MISTPIRFITVGNLKEPYLREAAAEYRKRLSGMCRVEDVELKEYKLPENPSEAEIKAALSQEAKAILAAVPSRSYLVAMCVEGQKFSSPDLAQKLEKAGLEASELCFVIGSSYGLAPEVKSAAKLRLSVSDLTFPHQLMRVILLEQLYRALNINSNGNYHH